MNAANERADQMTVVIARLLASSTNVFHGLASPLPAVAITLARRLHNPTLEYLNITGGVNVPATRPGVSTCGPSYWTGSQSFFSLTDIFDLSARGELDTAFLSGVQIDARGNLNNSVIGEFARPKVRLPGGAGSAAIVPRARQAIVWRARHDARVFVEKCDFVTAAGNVAWVVTPLGLFERRDGFLHLAGVAPYSSEEEIRANTGFRIPDTGGDASALPPPTEQELSILREVDPDDTRAGEFG